MIPDLNKAASCGEPSYVWRDGQERRLQMVLKGAENRITGKVLENGCGVGTYIERISPYAEVVIGLEYDLERAKIAHDKNLQIINAAGENLPFPDQFFDLVLSHEVLEHVEDDHQAVKEMVRALKPGGRGIIFTPNRGYPFETHGIYWRGKYRFGNIPLVNWLPRKFRNKLAPHVRVYSKKDLYHLFLHQPVRVLEHTIIFGAYDNIIARRKVLGKILRRTLHSLEGTGLRSLGLSHFLVVEKL